MSSATILEVKFYCYLLNSLKGILVIFNTNVTGLFTPAFFIPYSKGLINPS
jgi:hypothetical protein